MIGLIICNGFIIPKLGRQNIELIINHLDVYIWSALGRCHYTHRTANTLVAMLKSHTITWRHARVLWSVVAGVLVCRSFDR